MSNMDTPEHEARGRDPSFSGPPAPQSLSSRTASQLQLAWSGVMDSENELVVILGVNLGTVGNRWIAHVGKAGRDENNNPLPSPREGESS